jgi:hypothetical protein
LRTMNSWLFTVLCEEMGSQFKTVVSQRSKIGVLWQSSGPALPAEWNHVLSFQIFIEPIIKTVCKSHVCLSGWYLSSFNDLNLRLQSISVTVFSAYDKAKLKKKSSFWNLIWRKKLLSAFLHSMNFLSESKTPLSS